MQKAFEVAQKQLPIRIDEEYCIYVYVILHNAGRRHPYFGLLFVTNYGSICIRKYYVDNRSADDLIWFISAGEYRLPCFLIDHIIDVMNYPHVLDTAHYLHAFDAKHNEYFDEQCKTQYCQFMRGEMVALSDLQALITSICKRSQSIVELLSHVYE